MTPTLEVKIGTLRLRNPILAASGTFGSGVEARDFADLSEIGGVVTKSVTTDPRPGNPPPRIYETVSGLLNSIGLMNGGLDAFIRSTLPEFARLPCARIVNLAGKSPEDFSRLVAALEPFDAVDALELNVSCPNVSGGLDFGTDPALLEPLVARCRAATRKPLLVKLTPNVTDLSSLALAAERGGADALALVNTYLGMAIDWRRRRPELGSPTGAGGLSGPAIKPLALLAVYRVRKAVRIPLIGIGGILSVDDVMEFLVAGATAVQVGTANFVDPSSAVRIARDLWALAQEGSWSDLTPWVGSLKVPRD